jgi:hypothetical protein
LNYWSLAEHTARLAYTYRGFHTIPGRPANLHAVAVSRDLFVTEAGEWKNLGYAQVDPAGNPPKGMAGTQRRDALTGLAFSPDGATLALTTAAGAVEAFLNFPRTQASRTSGPVRAHGGWAVIVGFAPDGKSFVTRGEDRSVAWWGVGQPLVKTREWPAPPEGVRLWRFSPDGRYAALSVAGERLALVRLSAPFQLP